MSERDAASDAPIIGNTAATFLNMLSYGDLKMASMRPAYLASSAWHEHIPFAFWLMLQQQPRMLVELGVHYGVSYFAFCQAVEKLGFPSRCYAVDTWTGDEHAGFYGPEVYRTVKAYNDELYSGFSCLIRSTFDDACPHFSDGSIDLLHIDGLHTYSAVEHDFQSWRPRLSDCAVVLFHDTNVRERDFGVTAFIEELRNRYPVFEFLHGHGLALVGVGPNLRPGVQALFNSVNTVCGGRDVAEFFARLGRSCADTFSVRKLQAQLADRKACTTASTAPSYPDSAPGPTAA